MVEFVYMADFPFVRESETSNAGTVEFTKERMFHFAKLCIVADKYKVTGLESMACKQLRGCLRNKLTSVLNTWDASRLLVKPIQDDVIELVEFVYTKSREGTEVRSTMRESILSRKTRAH